MTSSAHYQPWTIQSTTSYANPWLAEAFTRDAETLTRALQKTISNDTSDTFLNSSDVVSSFYTPTGSGVSGSDPEMAATANQRRIDVTKTTGGAVAKKITKRKPRKTKKCETTFIMTDPSNFRQMVQEVTGVKLETLQQKNQQTQVIVKPEPKRLTGNGVVLPTLDTSSFFIDYSVNGQLEGGEGVGSGQRGGALTGCGDGIGLGQVAYGDSLIGGSGYGYEAYPSFPTLESWKVMCDY